VSKLKILFLGDSITEGIPGVPYIPMIKEELSKSNLVNRGVGGDTVSSLYNRVKNMEDLSSFDHIVLFIGVNDVFGKMNCTYKILKTLKKQKWAKSIDAFTKQYNGLVTHLRGENSNIVIISPLVLGEELNNKWNTELKEINHKISNVAKQNKLPYLDVFSRFEEYLSDKKISNYLPTKIRVLYNDSKDLTTCELVDKASIKRGLHLTLDGVHLNTMGASILSGMITEYLLNL
jgi:lysophospholipase L1-like esterase